MRFSFWTKEEIKTLWKMYPRESVGMIRKVLPDRTWMAITVKASRIGIKRTRSNLTFFGRINHDPRVNLYGPSGERITLKGELLE